MGKNVEPFLRGFLKQPQTHTHVRDDTHEIKLVFRSHNKGENKETA